MTTILVVDDLVTDRLLAGGLLKKHHDWQVIFAADGKDALLQMELNLPDAVLTDMQMPEMDGLQLVRILKEEYPLTPVVLMTARGSEEVAVEALRSGASSYVPKRLLAQDLVPTVERVLSASRTERDDTRLHRRLSEVSFSLENDLSLLSSMCRYLQQLIRERGLCDEATGLRIGVALEEALLNAYYHGNLEVSSELRDLDFNAYYELARQRALEAPYWDRRIAVTASFTAEVARLTIRDEGPGFDPQALPDPTDPANLDRAHGRGVLLMRTFMDEVQFNDRGNEVTLVKRRPADHVPASESASTDAEAN